MRKLKNPKPKQTKANAKTKPLCISNTSITVPRNTALLWLEGTSGDHLVQLPAQNWVNQSSLPSTVCSWLLNISKDGDSMPSLVNLFHTQSKNRTKHFLFMFKQNFLHFTLCPLPLVLSWVLQRTAWLCLLYAHIRCLLILVRSSWASSRLKSPSPLSLSSFVRCFRPLITITALHWTHLSMSMSSLYGGAQDWTQQSSCVSPLLSRGEGSAPLTCWWCSV